MTDRRHTMHVQADPAMARTLRVFVAEAARQLGIDEAEIDDLRLLATELLGNAIDTGSPHLDLTLDALHGRWQLEGRGVGPLDASDGMVHRWAILSGLAELTVADDVVFLDGAAD